MWGRLLMACSALVLLGACLESASNRCDDGRLCPEGTACDEVHDLCVRPDQLQDCAESDDGDPCTVGEDLGVCHDQVCLRAGCGDGFVLGAEQCDPSVPSSFTCDELDYYSDAPVPCLPDCRNDLRQCEGLCGDGEAQTSDEACDTDDLAGESCESLGYDGGTLACLPTCRFNLSDCQGFCGDGARTAGEACDGNDFGGEGCPEQGFHTGQLACADDCSSIITGGCSGTCGDGVKNGPEACDLDDLDGLDCQSFGWLSGDVTCAGDCGSIDTSACDGRCGDGEVQPQELCDASADPGLSCRTFGAAGGRLECNAYCQTAFDRCFWSRWRTQQVPTDKTLYALWGSGPDDVWAIGHTGAALHRGPLGWETAPSPSPGNTMFGIWGSAGDDVWAVGPAGFIRHYGGATWTTHDIASGNLLWDVWGTGASDVWIVGELNDGARILHKTTGGFVTVTPPAPGPGETTALKAIWGAGPGAIWAVGAGSVFHYDGSWEKEASGTVQPLNDVWGSGPDDVWAVGVNGTVVHRDAGGWSWFAQLAGSADLEAVWGTAWDDVWISGEGGALFHFDGTDWEPVASGTSDTLHALWASSNADQWMAGQDGTLMHHDGPGWRGDQTGIGNGVSAAWPASTSDVWAVGQGAIARWDGAGWTHTDRGTDWLVDVWGTGPNDVWVAGFTDPAGTALLLHDTGVGWDPVAPDTTLPLFAIAGGGGEVWAVGGSGAATHSSGGAWQIDDDLASLSNLNDVWVAGTGEVFVVGDLGTIAMRDLAGAWSTAFVPFNPMLLGVWGSSPTDVWACGEQGILLHFDGTTWEPFDAGTSTNLQKVWGTGPDDIWAVGWSGLLLHFDGTAWTPVDSGTTERLYDVSGTGPGDVWVTSNYGAVLHLTHGLPKRAGGDCAAPISLYCGSTLYGTTWSAPSALTSYDTCQNARDDTGGEVLYRFEAPMTRPITFRLQPHGGDLDLIALGAAADGTCDSTDCVSASQQSGAAAEEAIMLDLDQGDIVHLVVDGYLGASAGYTITAECPED